MQLEILRDSIIGPGKIEHPDGVQASAGDATRCGLVTELKTAKKGALVNVSDTVANRLIQLGSARIPLKKAA